MGRPGAGKGTQARLLAKEIGAEIYSSGNRLREMAKGHGFVNSKIKSTIERGELLPSWFSSHLFVEVLLSLSPEDKIVFEGACRKLAEAQSFDETTQWLDISDAEVEKRLLLRKSAEGRKDDASDSIGRRIKEYEENTAFAVEFFKSRGTLLEINGEQLIELVHQDVLKALRQ